MGKVTGWNDFLPRFEEVFFMEFRARPALETPFAGKPIDFFALCKLAWRKKSLAGQPIDFLRFSGNFRGSPQIWG